jgi:hypothetical protein
MTKLLVLVMGLIFLAACAGTPKYQGVLISEIFVSNLQPGPSGEGALRWIRPGLDTKKYNKVMVDYVVFGLAPDSDYKGIDGDEMKKLADAASKALVNAFQVEYPVVSEPGPDVVRVKFGITDFEPKRPLLNEVNSVVPMGSGITIIKKGDTNSWTGSRMTKGEVIFIDSTTNEALAAAYGEYYAKSAERVNKWRSAEDAFAHWGERIRLVWKGLKTEEMK